MFWPMRIRLLRDSGADSTVLMLSAMIKDITRKMARAVPEMEIHVIIR